MAMAMDELIPATQNRKISVSYVTDIGPTALEQLEPGQQNNLRLDPALKALQQRILRLQVSQVVLGLTLMILSAVALIEDRNILGLGFAGISAMIIIFSAAIGIQQCNLRFVAICNIIALLALLPSFYFVFENLIRHSRLYIRTSYHHYPSSPAYLPPGFNHTIYRNLSAEEVKNYQATILNQYGGIRRPNNLGGGAGDSGERSNNTLWILCWLEMAHLVPLGASLLYLLFLYRYLNYYTHF